MGNINFRSGAIILLLVLGVVSALFYGKSITMPPNGHHAWAMADYHAMAIKFADNHLNIFQPQTFSLTTKDGITASDFPLPAWLTGVGMFVTSSDKPVIFRVLTLCFGFLGFFFFYRGLCERGIKALDAVLLTLFLWFLPGLVYYHDGFMPSIWALSAFLIGLWAMQRDIRGDNRFWAVAIGAFVLAALIRKPYVLQLLAVGAWHIFTRKDTRKTLIGIAGLGVFALWQIYDWHLYRTYGSIFLRDLMMPHSTREAWLLITSAWKKWASIWLSPLHIIWLLLAIILTVKQLRTRKGEDQSTAWHFGGALFFGLFYVIVMLRQFSDHEYYAIDSFYPVVFVGVLYSAQTMCKPTWHRPVLLGLTLLAGVWAFRTLHWYSTRAQNAIAQKTNMVYGESRQLLESLGVPKDARILVFEAYSSNLPLIGMGRSGYCLLSSKAESQEAGLALQPDYAVCLDTNFVSEVVNDNPAVVQELEYVGRNQDLWVFRPGNRPGQTLEKLLAIAHSTLVDTSLSTSEEYLFSQRLPLNAGDKVVFQGFAGIKTGGELMATVALFQSGAPVKVLERKFLFEATETPAYIATDLNIPVLAADEVRIYVWNPKRGHTDFKNFRISLLKMQPDKR
jgi:hypothetical protein